MKDDTLKLVEEISMLPRWSFLHARSVLSTKGSRKLLKSRVVSCLKHFNFVRTCKLRPGSSSTTIHNRLVVWKWKSKSRINGNSQQNMRCFSPTTFCVRNLLKSPVFWRSATSAPSDPHHSIRRTAPSASHTGEYRLFSDSYWSHTVMWSWRSVC